MKPSLNHSVLHLFLVLLASWEYCFCGNQFQCVYNVGKMSGLNYLIKVVGGVSTRADVRRISALQCAALCVSRGEACQSYSYNPATQECFTNNITTRLTGWLCGVSVDIARYQPAEFGSTYVAYAGRNKVMMECMSGAIVSGDWPKHSLSGYNCIDLCPYGQYPCEIFIGNTVSCQSCAQTTSTICNSDKPYMSTSSTTRAVCSPIY